MNTDLQNTATNLPTLEEVLHCPDTYTPEQLAPFLRLISLKAQEVFLQKKVIEQVIISKMNKMGATKLEAKVDGEILAVYTLTPGRMEAVKDADKLYKEAGCDPLEIGNYNFKASWKAASQLIKFGGEKAKLIESLFQRTADTLKTK